MLLKRAAETWTLVAADAVALFGLVLTAFPPGCVRLLVLLLRDTFSPVSSEGKGERAATSPQFTVTSGRFYSHVCTVRGGRADGRADDTVFFFFSLRFFFLNLLHRRRYCTVVDVDVVLSVVCDCIWSVSPVDTGRLLYNCGRIKNSRFQWPSHPIAEWFCCSYAAINPASRVVLAAPFLLLLLLLYRVSRLAANSAIRSSARTDRPTDRPVLAIHSGYVINSSSTSR